MDSKKKGFQFGEIVEGFEIPVLNEREIRAAAGILFVVMFISIMLAITKGDFTMLKHAVVLFFTDMVIRVFINPRFAPTLIIGRLIVRNQVPEYVGAPQKKFAWVIGVGIASVMLALLVIVNSYSPITGLLCFICLIFLFFESAFGICLGCKFYPLFYKDKVQHCPGEVCDVKSRQDIQKTPGLHWLIVLAFVVFIILIVAVFNETFSVPPHNLFGIDTTS